MFRCNILMYLMLTAVYFKDWLDSNLYPLINNIHNQLEEWRKLRLSWFGHIAALKMKILPKFLFIFQNISMDCTNHQWEHISNFNQDLSLNMFVQK